MARKVFVGSLPNGITDEELRAEFGKYGQVHETFVKPGCEPGRQWAFVTFATPEQAQFVKEQCDRILVFPGHDRACDVMLAKNQGTFGRDVDPPMAGIQVGYQSATGNGYSGSAMAGGTAARKVFVGSLPDGIQDEALRAEFSKYGGVEDVFIKPGCEPGRQWAFVTFAAAEQAAMAAQMCNGMLQFPGSYKPCEVTMARNQGMFGQDPLVDPNAQSFELVGLEATNAYDPNSGLSESQLAPRKIFVGSLPDTISDPLLRSEFSKFGQITDLFMKTTCESNRQWAFITFANSEQAQFARNSCDKVLTFPGSDRPCEVTMARHQGMFGKESIEPTVPGAAGGSPAPSGMEGPRKIFVGSLPDTISDGALRAEFCKYGKILDLYLKTTCEPGRQWAFITFSSSEEAAYAKEATDRVLQFPGADRTCEVMLAKNQGKFGQAPLANFGRAQAPLSMEASQPPPPTTPPPAHLTAWRQYRTASGLPYYHNASTGITQWECPPELQVPGQADGYLGEQAAPSNGAAVYGGQQRYTPY